MTAPYKAPHWRESGDIQWADYGVNVGHAVYGGIHFHPAAAQTASARGRRGTTHPARMVHYVDLRSALFDLARACQEVAAALAYLRPDEAGKEE
ncbi:hypothetical protein [Streptomyces sp. SID8499]|uniref:hypothetical protein n=1 Tax=Streptomyces sp. SID8499 TaxID=2706106 RepID=UPI0013CB223B|nr:hypothetical protein [Streptomyces sp. SID8499]NED35621.1 hypothetical protein [Streptomyces sp. SID8499]